MILKIRDCSKEEKCYCDGSEWSRTIGENCWHYFDVDSFRISKMAYVEAECHGPFLKTILGRATEIYKGCPMIDGNPNSDTKFFVFVIVKDGKEYSIAVEVWASIFLLNDKGKTIEKIN